MYRWEKRFPWNKIWWNELKMCIANAQPLCWPYGLHHLMVYSRKHKLKFDHLYLSHKKLLFIYKDHLFLNSYQLKTCKVILQQKIPRDQLIFGDFRLTIFPQIGQWHSNFYFSKKASTFQCKSILWQVVTSRSTKISLTLHECFSKCHLVQSTTRVYL